MSTSCVLAAGERTVRSLVVSTCLQRGLLQMLHNVILVNGFVGLRERSFFGERHAHPQRCLEVRSTFSVVSVTRTYDYCTSVNTTVGRLC